MPTVTLNITCNIGELPTVASFIYASFINDKADFITFSKDYDTPFDTNLKTKIDAIINIISPAKYTAELEVITNRIYTNQHNLAILIDLVARYIQKATGLTIAYDDFGISAVRSKNNQGDIEGLTTKLQSLITNITVPANLSALKARGFTTTQLTSLQKFHDDLLSDNTAQYTKIAARANAVNANYTQINDLWASLKDVLETGKAIYKKTNSTKAELYTLAKILTQIRNNKKKTKIFGAVTLNGKPITSKAKITLIPVNGGKKRVINTDPKGNYEKTGIEIGDYIATCAYKGQLPITSSFTLQTKIDLEQNFDFK